MGYAWRKITASYSCNFFLICECMTMICVRNLGMYVQLFTDGILNHKPQVYKGRGLTAMCSIANILS